MRIGDSIAKQVMQQRRPLTAEQTISRTALSTVIAMVMGIVGAFWAESQFLDRSAPASHLTEEVLAGAILGMVLSVLPTLCILRFRGRRKVIWFALAEIGVLVLSAGSVYCIDSYARVV